MKLSSKQLRNLIEQVVSEAGEDRVDLVREIEPFVTEAIIQYLRNEESLDIISSNAWEMMMGTIGENVPAPGRPEDAEQFARAVADRVLRDSSLQEIVVEIAKSVIRSAYYFANGK